MTDLSHLSQLRPTTGSPLALALLLALATLPAARAQAAADPYAPPAETDCGGAVVEMKDWGGRAAVQAFIGDQGPYLFHVDTGTPYAVILDTALAAGLGIAVAPVADADDADARGGVLDAVRVGRAGFRGVPFETLDFSRLGGGEHPAGILGLPLFASCLLTLDHPGHQVRIATGELRADDPDVVPYHLDPAHGTYVTLPLELAGRKIEAHLDTGSPGEVTLLDGMAAKLPLQGAPVHLGTARTPDGEAAIRSAVLDGDLVLAGYRAANPRLAFADLGPMKASGVGNVGSGLLRHFEVTLDQRTLLLRIREPKAEVANAGPAPVVRQSRSGYTIGAMMRPEPDALVVAGLVPGGAAEAAGLEPGDRIVAVNGTPFADLGQGALGAAFGAPDPVALRIERDGKPLDLTVTPKPR